ncbi:MAG: amidohydrolase family protein, partial [Bacteroidota bacterium]
CCHAIPEPYRTAGDREGYLSLMLDEVLPEVAGEGLADYIDVFCEKVAFSPEETDRILTAGERYGLKGKIHTNQFYSLGGIEMALRHQALSVDHLEVVNEKEIQLLATNNMIATLLPSAPFFLNDHYPPGRSLVDAGVPIALASDYNPGSTPSGNMPLVISLACIKCRLLPEEAIQAATINGAYALELNNELGSIERGKRGAVILTKPIPSLAYLPYSFGSDLIEQVIY